MRNYTNIVSILILCLIVSCKSDEKKSNDNDVVSSVSSNVNYSSDENLNVSILLDLSDRISPKLHPNPTMEIAERDVKYINSVSNAFLTHIKSKKVRQINDKIQLYFEPEPSNQKINNISSKLKFEISRQNASLDLLEDIDRIYSSLPKEIYDLAIEDNNYVGSDTWSFLKDKVEDYCIADGYRNILVILSDGYIYHKDGKIKDGNMSTYITTKYLNNNNLKGVNWEEKYTKNKFGLIPANSDLSNLEILVLGVNPNKGNPYELEIIKKFWSDWFDEMKVAKYEIKTAELPSNLNSVIQDFILNN